MAEPGEGFERFLDRLVGESIRCRHELADGLGGDGEGVRGELGHAAALALVLSFAGWRFSATHASRSSLR